MKESLINKGVICSSATSMLTAAGIVAVELFHKDDLARALFLPFGASFAICLTLQYIDSRLNNSKNDNNQKSNN
jgi:arginine exporter protein ArgO